MNTSKEIFARYIMTVFTDGSVSTERIPAENDAEESAPNKSESCSISSKIQQMTEALRCMKEIYDRDFSGIDSKIIFSEVYKNGIVEAAEKFGVTPNSVADKLTRKCGLDKPAWLPMLRAGIRRELYRRNSEVINRGCRTKHSFGILCGTALRQ